MPSHDGRCLVVRGGWEGHQPVAATDLFLDFLDDRGFAVAVRDTPAAYADESLMTDLDLVLQCVTMGELDDAALRGLEAAVRAGTGLAGWHGGIVDSYRANAEYLHLVGGQFAAHPGKDPTERVGEQVDFFVPHRVEVVPAARDHPIVAGIDDFDLVTEQYWVLTDEAMDVLATTTHPVRDWGGWTDEVTVPAVWTRQWGRGRVFVMTPGHDLDVLRHPQVRTIMERGLAWAAR